MTDSFLLTSALGRLCIYTIILLSTNTSALRSSTMKLSWLFATVVLVLLIQTCFATLTVITGELANTTIPTAQVFKKGDDFSVYFEPISGELVLDNATSVDGKIVYLVLIPNSFYTTVRELQNRGAIGVLTVESGIIPGRSYCTYNDETFLNEIKIPIALATTKDLDPILKLVQNGDSIEITLTSEGNQWADVFNSHGFLAVFRVIYSIIGSLLAIYAVVKLVLFIYYQGSQFNVPQICLAIEFIGNCLRVVYLAGDPFGCFFNYDFGVVAIFQAFNGLLTQPTFFLITMYWHEAMTDASVRIYPFLSKLKIPFYVFTCVLLFLAVLFPLLNLFLGVKFTTAITAMYAAIALGFLIFYIVTVVRIMRRLAKSTRTTKRTRNLMEINRNMIMSGVAKFATIAVGFLFVGESIVTRPVPYVSLWAVLYVLFYFDSFCRIWTFNLKSAKGVSSSGRSASLNSSRSRTTQSEKVENMLKLSANSVVTTTSTTASDLPSPTSLEV